jgi:DNA-binding winged helix-turn-helix (wHTH) protein
MDYCVQRVLRFDRFTLDLRRGCLRAGDRDIDLRPKAFEVLCYLANNAGRLVPKQELFEAVWPAVTVCDDSLVQCIRELRYKLDDNDRRLIKTVSRRGYLMDAAVSALALQSPSDGSRMQVPEAPQTHAAGLRVPLGALWPTATHKLRLWGAATLAPPLVAVVVTLGIDHGFFLTSQGPSECVTELRSRPNVDQDWFDTVRGATITKIMALDETECPNVRIESQAGALITSAACPARAGVPAAGNGISALVARSNRPNSATCSTPTLNGRSREGER